eukprot:TRINITY_DN12142_c0_g1_i1.p1 TRINITY_DN12142_c0_g1~~TRINITY_DN12142_c0_g1_i1.p1  ORF type:complete len:910 (+),score=249.75 TRINITY_DN12142_c0_g1_i1:67-2796(+)
MASYYLKLKKTAEKLLKEGKGLLDDRNAFSLALSEECFEGSDVGKVVLAVLEEGGKRGNEEEVEEAIHMLKLMMDKEKAELFSDSGSMDEHLAAIVVPLSGSVQQKIHKMAETSTHEENKRLFPTLLHALTSTASWEAETSHLPRALTAFDLLTASPHIASAVVDSPTWVCSTNGCDFSLQTILGPFFSYQPIKSHVLFPVKQDKVTVSQKDVSQWDPSIYYKALAKSLKNNFLMKKPADWPLLREGMLKYFEGFLKRNREVKKTIANRDICSPLDALLTLFGVLLELTEPVYERATVMQQIKICYTIGESRLHLPKDEPRVVADTKQVAALVVEKTKKPNEYTFSCEIFFLCMEAMDTCFVNGIKYSENLERHEVVLMSSQLNQMRMMGAQERMVSKARDELNHHLRVVYLMRLYRQMKTQFAVSVIRFCEYTAKWLLNIAEMNPVPPVTPPQNWTIVPEYFVTNNCRAFSWFRDEVLNEIVGVLVDTPCILSQLTAFMASPAYIKNPYSRAAHVEAFHSVMSSEGTSVQELTTLDLEAKIVFQAASSEYICGELMPNMMSAYVDLESLGGSNQFFEKFTYRYYVGVLIRKFYNEMVFREAVLTCSKKSDVGFVKFFNMMLNDVNWLLSEGLKRVAKIHEYEVLSEKPGEWASMTSDARRAIEEGHTEATQQCKPYMTLANEAMTLVSALVRDTPSSFLQSALIGKVADMLNFFLLELSGDGVKDLRIKNPEKYDFQHAVLIRQIVQMYISLCSSKEHQQFERAVAEDERSYSPEKFATVLSYLQRKAAHLLLWQDDIAGLSKIFVELKTIYTDLEQEDVDLPDNLVDPIMQCPLKDPLQLPSSGEWCERKVITQHLLNDSTNPFNRAPLTIEELIAHNKQPDIKAEGDKIREQVRKLLEAAKVAAKT